MISVAAGMVVVGAGLYLNRYVSRWRFRGDPRIMGYVEPLAKFGLIVFAIGVGLLAAGIGLAAT